MIFAGQHIPARMRRGHANRLLGKVRSDQALGVNANRPVAGCGIETVASTKTAIASRGQCREASTAIVQARTNLAAQILRHENRAKVIRPQRAWAPCHRAHVRTLRLDGTPACGDLRRASLGFATRARAGVHVIPFSERCQSDLTSQRCRGDSTYEGDRTVQRPVGCNGKSNREEVHVPEPTSPPLEEC